MIENAFGRLKGRWHCLLKRNECDVSLVKPMVLTSCALHNLCESHGEENDGEWDVAVPVPVAEPAVAVSQSVEEEGRDVRGFDALLE